MTNKDKILLIIQAAQGWSDGLTFQKLIFVIQNKYTFFNYNFVRWDYGPYCCDLQEDLEELIRKGEIQKVVLDKGTTRMVTYDSKVKNPGTLSKEIQNEVENFKNKSRKEVLHKIFHEYDIFQYELGDRIIMNKGKQ